MSKDGNIRNNGRIMSGRKKEDGDKFRENYQKIDWTKRNPPAQEISPSKPSPSCNEKS